ncbi:FtsX-like permease family protein [Mollicutes bacterium LVI A0039]|nr:FtsX-like permease family protein [Mollicutes bacterium LVI A0039]
MKKTMKIGFIRDIKQSKGRFISILLLMFLSTFTLVGLKIVGPDIRATGDAYFDKYRLADITLMSTYGFAAEEQALINELVDNGDVEFGYIQDVTIGDTAESIRIFSNSKEISEYELIDGKMPTKSDQIAISNQMAEEYPIGSKIEITEKGDEEDYLLTNHSFTVVGHVNSLEIVSTLDLGATTVGTGQLNGYGVITDSAFDSEVYMIARVAYDDLQSKDAFLNDYLDTVKVYKKELEASITDLPEQRIATIKNDAYQEINENKQKLDDAAKELDDAQVKLDEGKSNLDNAKATLDSSSAQISEGERAIADGYTKISDGLSQLEIKQQELDQAQQELSSNLTIINNGQTEIDQALAEINANQLEVDNSRASLDAGLNQYLVGINNLQMAIADIDKQLLNPDLTDEERLVLEQTKNQLNIELAVVNGEYDYYVTSIYNPSITELNNAQLLIDGALVTINSKQTEIDAGREQLRLAQEQLTSGKQQLDAAKATLVQNQLGLDYKANELSVAKQQVATGFAEYYTGLDEYQANLLKFNEEEPQARLDIADGYKQIADAEQELEDLSMPVYTVYTREETPTSSGYSVFSSLATSIDKVANVFPIMLYAVAALVTFTTMTRYVEDERINTGTLLSLGYSEREIKRKYIVYGATSSSIGAVIGIMLGAVLIPELLYTSFRGEFTTPDLVLSFDLGIACGAMLVSVLCAIIPAFIVTASEFHSSPASLLLPKPPGNGSKIFLERITPIWNRLSFSHKVTARNIFRYKKRMLMTIFGVSGSVALLFTGLALQASIGNVSDIQFGEIIHYDMIAVEKSGMTPQEANEIEQLLSSTNVESSQDVYVESVSLEAGKNAERQAITMMVGTNENNYVQFRDRKTGETLKLNDGEVFINERLATALEINQGDTFTVNSAENIPVELKVGGIIEMYAGHFLFATEDTYREAFGETPVNNSIVFKLKDNSPSNIEQMAIDLMKLDGVQTVLQNASLIYQVENIATSLNSVMKLLIVLSVLLAVVILYNITNINVSERMRELSTTKVLGYYDKEVTLYIYRETMLLSIIGIIVGYGLGRIIHLFMMKTVAPLNMMFDQHVAIIAFIAPAILIIAVLVVLGIIIHFRLTKVDMLEALKSVE